MSDVMIDFEKGDGLVPAIIQESGSNTVLMLGYMNEAAYQKTVSDRRVTFFSRSKQRLWTKGETSGNYLQVNCIAVDCDSDTLLISVTPLGPVCHTGARTCFGDQEEHDIAFLSELTRIIKERASSTSPSSYTASLLESGVEKVSQKVGEEAVEVVIEALRADETAFLNESADLLFHLLVLFEAKGVSLTNVVDVLKSRHSGKE